MKCPKCGTTFSHDRDYCINCGAILNKEIVDKLHFNDSDDLIYYFKEYEEGKSLPKINIGYILLPLPLSFYYKMYYDAIIFILLGLHAVFAATVVQALTGIFGFFYIVFSFVAWIAFYIFDIVKINEKRTADANSKITRIRRENEGKSEEEIIELIKKEAKGNFVLFIVFLILQLLICGFFLMFLIG